MLRPCRVARSWRSRSQLKRRKSFCLMVLILTSMMQMVYLNMESLRSSVPRTQISGRRSRRFILRRNSTEASSLTWHRAASFSKLRFSAFMSWLQIFCRSRSFSWPVSKTRVQLSPSPFWTVKEFLQQKCSSFSIISPPCRNGTQLSTLALSLLPSLATISSVLRRQRVPSSTSPSMVRREAGSSRMNSTPGSWMEWGRRRVRSISPTLQRLTTWLSFQLLEWLTSSKVARTLQMLERSGWSGGVCFLISFMSSTYLGRRCTGLMRQSLSVSWWYLGLVLAWSAKWAKSWRRARSSRRALERGKLWKYSKQSLKKWISFSTLSNITLQCEYCCAWLNIVAKNSSFSCRIWSTFANRVPACSPLIIRCFSSLHLKSVITTLRSRMYLSSVSTSYLIRYFRFSMCLARRRTRALASSPLHQPWITRTTLSICDSCCIESIIMPMSALPVILIAMKEQQTNLLHFLQRNSLFPQHSRPSHRQRSRRSRVRNSLREHHSPLFQSRFQPRFTLQHLQDPSSSIRVSQALPEQSPRPQSFNLSSKQHSSSPPEPESASPKQPDIYVWAEGEEPYDSTRTESLYCLSNISRKLQAKLGENEKRIQSFRRKVTTWISEELLKAQKEIVEMVEAAFLDQEKVIREYVSQQEKAFSSHLLFVRQALQDQAGRVEQLERELRGEDWKQTAGQILEFDLQKKIDHYLDETDRIRLPEWDPRCFLRDHLQIIQLQLQEMLKLSTFAC